MATWTSSYITDLPDSAFACIDSKGRHYPHHDASGKVDLPHLRNALSRVNQDFTTSCGKAHLQAHAEALGVGKAAPLKASPIDDDAFRLLAFPFTGPIPFPGTKGVDLDGQWFSEATDIKPDWLPFRPTDWHHGGDARLRREVLGKAIDLGNFDGASREPDDDGWWVTVWMDRGQRRLDLVRKLAERGALLFGSSETVPGLATVKARDGSIQPWRPGLVGEIMTWPYWRQTLSTSPQNTHSVIRPLKATLEEIEAAGERPDASFWSDIEDALRSLGHSLRTPSVSGASGAKAGRSLGRSSEADLRAALAQLDQAMDRAQRVIAL